MSRRSAKARRFRKVNARKRNARWRDEPASERQRTVLRRIERDTGERFAADITRGEASEAIARRFAEDGDARRAAQRAERARRRGERMGARGRPTADGPAWRFGAGQTAREERQEIKEAMRSGRGGEYMAAQADARCREAGRRGREEA
ncbi:MAG: hypothetical protein M3N16_03100 [Actinomycetota bacterium]|nr:hypothetical protein [Actinomycetota bacterium]